MIIQAIPQFFTTDLDKTMAYYADKLGFATDFKYGEPAFYGGASRDGATIFFRHVDKIPDRPQADYDEDLLDAYIAVKDAAALEKEIGAKGVTIHRELTRQPWQQIEIVVKDDDGRLICFGQDGGEG